MFRTSFENFEMSEILTIQLRPPSLISYLKPPALKRARNSYCESMCRPYTVCTSHKKSCFCSFLDASMLGRFRKSIFVKVHTKISTLSSSQSRSYVTFSGATPQISVIHRGAPSQPLGWHRWGGRVGGRGLFFRFLYGPDGWSWGSHRLVRSKQLMMLVWKMNK